MADNARGAREHQSIPAQNAGAKTTTLPNMLNKLSVRVVSIHRVRADVSVPSAGVIVATLVSLLVTRLAPTVADAPETLGAVRIPVQLGASFAVVVSIHESEEVTRDRVVLVVHANTTVALNATDVVVVNFRLAPSVSGSEVVVLPGNTGNGAAEGVTDPFRTVAATPGLCLDMRLETIELLEEATVQLEVPRAPTRGREHAKAVGDPVRSVIGAAEGETTSVNQDASGAPTIPASDFISARIVGVLGLLGLSG